MSEPTWTVTIHNATVTLRIEGAREPWEVLDMLADELRAIRKDTGLGVQCDPALVEVQRDE